VTIRCVFASDLHGDPERYARLLAAVEREQPAALFLGGDLLPGLRGGPGFFEQVLGPALAALRTRLGPHYPRVFAILGNDDERAAEPGLIDLEARGLLHYTHGRRFELEGFPVYGYQYVPPTPFGLKDWERYDVSRSVDPGCVSPEEGWRSVAVDAREQRWSTIREDLERLTGEADLQRAVFLFHTPPHATKLDLAALAGRSVDHAPLDPHVGSIAVRRFIERRQPWLTLHGHVHESVRLSGAWSERIGRTLLLGAAHDGPELCLVRFALEQPERATRELC